MAVSRSSESLPPPFAGDLIPEIHQLLADSERTIVVLDNDPTGTCTVFDVPVLATTDPEIIRDTIDEAPPLLFILIGLLPLSESLGSLLAEYGEEIIVILRSDDSSPAALSFLGIPEAPTLIIPEPGSPLPPSSVNLTTSELRSGDVTSQLAALSPGCTCVVNSTHPRDLHVLAKSLHLSPRRFLLQADVTFIQSISGIISRPLLEPWQIQDLDPNPHGGLIILTPGSSYGIPENATFHAPGEGEISSINDTLKSGKSLILSSSDSLPSLIRHITIRPSFIIVVGNAAASPVLTDALGITSSRVLGRILPGVPVWMMGNETSHPGLTCAILPNNLADDSSLIAACEKLSP